jgi:hypothetical protein
MLQKPVRNEHVAKLAVATDFAARLALLHQRSFLNMVDMWREGQASVNPQQVS